MEAAHQFLDRADSTTRKLGQQDHALRLVVLEERHVNAHDINSFYQYHDILLKIWIFFPIHTAAQIRLPCHGYLWDFESRGDLQLTNNFSEFFFLQLPKRFRIIAKSRRDVDPARKNFTVLISRRGQNSPFWMFFLFLDLQILMITFI